jgi:two-component system sensor histidine kinase BasS
MYSDMEEMVAVTTSLNQLLGRLDHTIQQERLFTADAAHELRTPLAGLRLHLELMANSGNPQAPMLLERIDRLMHTIEQLLMLSRAGQALASGHYITLSWTRDIIAPLKMEMDEMMALRQQSIEWPLTSEDSVQGDPVLLRLMLRNLLENASRYSPEGSVITVSLAPQESGTKLMVSDQGPGIDEKHRETLTEPFRRMDQRYGGSGLGLNIVLRIVQLHHGKLSLDNRSECSGLNACCWLPTQIQ